jgi:hypothetical protein
MKKVSASISIVTSVLYSPLIGFKGQEYQDEYGGISKSFRSGRLERELQMVQLSATTCSCIAILWISPVSFVAITFRVASQRVFVVVVVVVVAVVYFVIGNFWIHPRTMELRGRTGCQGEHEG